jgi:hypothetical protein
MAQPSLELQIAFDTLEYGVNYRGNKMAQIAWRRVMYMSLVIAASLVPAYALGGEFNVVVKGDISSNDSVFSEHVTSGFASNFQNRLFSIYVLSDTFHFKGGLRTCYASAGVIPRYTSFRPQATFDASRLFDASKKYASVSDGDLERLCIEDALDSLMNAEIGVVWPAWKNGPAAHRKAGDDGAQTNVAPPSQMAENAKVSNAEYRTYCNNASCTRKYANGKTISFIACMNPATMLPMMSGNVSDGRGDCTGEDSAGNPYGVGHVGGMSDMGDD